MYSNVNQDMMLECLNEIMALTRGESGFSKETFERIENAIANANRTEDPMKKQFSLGSITRQDIANLIKWEGGFQYTKEQVESLTDEQMENIASNMESGLQESNSFDKVLEECADLIINQNQLV